MLLCMQKKKDFSRYVEWRQIKAQNCKKIYMCILNVRIPITLS